MSKMRPSRFESARVEFVNSR